MHYMIFSLGILFFLFFSSCKNSNSFSIAVGGDVMLARGIEDRIRQKGMNYVFSGIHPILQQCNFSIFNLESPLTDTLSPVNKKFVFAAPCSLAASLSQAGVSLLNLANNHTLDHGKLGLENTLSALLSKGLTPVGIDQQPQITEHADIEIAFFGANLVTGESSPENEDLIYQPSPGQLLKMVGSYHIKNPESVIIVNLHWGFEYREFPSSSQRLLAHNLIDTGASIIAGHHPHVLQPIEFYKRGVIVYSLGNLVFDQLHPPTTKSMIVEFEFLGTTISHVHVHPLIIDSGKPKPCEKHEWGQLEIIGTPSKISWHFLN